jgi:hypothetical protein
LNKIPIITVVMSLPLLFSAQLRQPPEWLYGLPFIVTWTWGLLAIVTVPVLLVIECAVCLWLLSHRTAVHSTLWRHAGALVVAGLAEAVYMIVAKGWV